MDKLFKQALEARNHGGDRQSNSIQMNRDIYKLFTETTLFNVGAGRFTALLRKKED